MATQTMHEHHMSESTPSHMMDRTTVGPYAKFGIMIVLSFLAMYFLMFAMIDSTVNYFNNINTFYMAGLMTVPMAIVEIVLMRKMYPKQNVNLAIIFGGVILFGFFWFGIRDQIGVGKKQFLRSMIPHHAGAILMCNEASVTNAQIKDLCVNIIKSQQAEIDQMKSILNEMRR